MEVRGEKKKGGDKQEKLQRKDLSEVEECCILFDNSGKLRLIISI